MLKKGEGKSVDFSNGPEAAKADRIRKAATAMKGKFKQPKGGAESGAKARYHTVGKERKYSEDLEF